MTHPGKPIEHCHILCWMNDEYMQWYSSIGLGHIAFRSWFCGQILASLLHFSIPATKVMCEMYQMCHE